MSMFSMYVYMVIQMSNVYVYVHVYVYYVSSIMYHVPCIKYHVSRTMYMFMHAHACLYIPIMYVLRIDIHMYIAYYIYIHTYTYVYNSGKDKNPWTSITILAFLGMQNDRTKILSTNKCHCPIDQHPMYPNLQWEQMLVATCNYQHEGQNIFKIKRTASKPHPT